MGILRTKTKIGDIFTVNLDDDNLVYFQYIANDLTQLNSDVIRVFKKVYSISSKMDFSQLLQSEIDFHAHTMINIGVKQFLFQKVGNYEVYPNISNILFRDTSDYGHKVGDKPILLSKNWFVWKINDNKFTDVGVLSEKYKFAEIGIVIPPFAIVERIKTGKFNFIYPNFE